MADLHGEKAAAPTRRGLFAWGLRFAAGLPAIMVGFQGVLGTAHADDDQREGDDSDKRRGRGRGVGNEERQVTFSADLVPVNLVNGSDFSGSSDTGSGRLDVLSREDASAASVGLRIRGATANTSYALIFQAANGSRTGTLGTLNTDSDGDAAAVFDNVLPEPGSAASNGLGTRVGIFVLSRSGAGDAFVTAA
jgi:hypothetical protein